MAERRKKICIVVEGCYPYVVGGVSSWVHNLIRNFPEHDFIVQSIIASREQSGKFKYELPENVIEVKEIYLNDDDYISDEKQAKYLAKRRHKDHLNEQQYQALRALVYGQNIDWKVLFSIFQGKHLSIDNLLMGDDFFTIVKDFYLTQYNNIVFTDFLWTMRSMFLPLCLVLKNELVECDVVHCVSTGYAGIWGAMVKTYYPKTKLLISEHGIYTREREEELIKAKWVTGVYKDMWISQFRKISTCAYEIADIVTSLFENARSLQIDLGCPEEKTLVTPNGVEVNRFSDIPRKAEDDPYVNIGAIVRLTPIKDIKSLLNAFYYAKKQESKLKLWVMGPADEDKQYANECYAFAKQLGLEDVEFTGSIQTTQYIGKMDATILSSISEGQPLTILEGFAAHVPAIATNVGNCEGLILGEGSDQTGAAGIVVPIMNVKKLADAMVYMARHPMERQQMAEVGYQRVIHKYPIERMREKYHLIYDYLTGISNDFPKF